MALQPDLAGPLQRREEGKGGFAWKLSKMENLAWETETVQNSRDLQLLEAVSGALSIM